MAILDPNALNPGALSMGGPVPFQVPMQAGGPIDPRRLLAPTQMMPPQRMLPQANAPFDMGAMPPEAPQAPPQPSTPFQASGPEPMAPNDSIGSGGGESVESGESGTPYSWKDPTVPTGVLGRLKDAGSRIGSGFMQEMSTPSGKKGLRAFGAAMLGAPNFWQGLSKGTTAYDETRDAEEAANKPKTAMVADGAFMASTDRAGNTTFSPNQQIQNYTLERETAKEAQLANLSDLKTGSAERIATLRADAAAATAAAAADRSDQRAQFQATQANNRLMASIQAAQDRDARRAMTDEGFRRQDGKNRANGLNSAYTAAEAAPDNIASLNTLEAQFKTAGAGAGGLAVGKRLISQLTGYDIGNVNLGDKNVVESLSSQIELKAASSQRGLGALTEGERAIIRQTIPRLGTDPRAAQQIIDIMRKREERSMALVDSWTDSGGQGDFRDFSYRFNRSHAPASYAPNPAPAKGPPKGYGRIGGSFYAPPLLKAQLLANQNNPRAIADFDKRMGSPGAAAAFIKQSKQK
jgi:hypothetical protein